LFRFQHIEKARFPGSLSGTVNDEAAKEQPAGSGASGVISRFFLSIASTCLHMPIGWNM
jgi:hypothetical protein